MSSTNPSDISTPSTSPPTLHTLPIYANIAMTCRAPSETLPTHGLPASVAHQLIKDELNLDGNPRTNLASYVTTWMEPEAEDLMRHAARKNFIDLDQYPKSRDMEKRCVTMLARLLNAPLGNGEEGVGLATVGSTEAILLAGLAMKFLWREHMAKGGLAATNPNIVLASNVHVAWHKMCKYFDIEERIVPVDHTTLGLDPATVAAVCDQNTIGVNVTLGTTYNGYFEDVKAVHDVVEELNRAYDWCLRIHVDAASGGFVAPFVHPNLVWDFRLPLVKSINLSGHKFGLVYAGVGWGLWREKKDLPHDLAFHVSYLGGDQCSYTLNFSRGASQIIAQYYQFVRLGWEGYRAILSNGMRNADYLRERLTQLGRFSLVDIGMMPLVAFELSDPHAPYTVHELQDRMRASGWIVPAYKCPPGADDREIIRVVVKQNFTHDLIDDFVKDLDQACRHLEEMGQVLGPAPTASTKKAPGAVADAAGSPSVAHRMWQHTSTGVGHDPKRKHGAKKHHPVC